MSSINKVILIGHIGNNIQMHHFEGGGSLGRLPLATNESWKDKQSGEKKERTDWHNLVFRNKSAELMEKYTSKGDQIYIEGKLRTREWESEQGEKRYTTEVHVETFKFLKTSKTQEQGVASENGKNEKNDDLPY